MLTGMTGFFVTVGTLALALGFTVRLNRLIMVDHLGQRWIISPALDWLDKHPRYGGLVIGLWCPFCIGFWVGCLVLGSLWAVGGPDGVGPLVETWRWVAGAFTLNYLAGHLNRTLDPVLTDDDTPAHVAE